jgi:hypothetical protein
MRYTLLVATLAACVATQSAFAFDVQNGGGAPASGGAANLASDGSSVPGVSLDTDLRAQLGLADDAKAADAKKTGPFGGLQFSGGVSSGGGTANQSTMGYDESPWVAPRQRPGSN